MIKVRRERPLRGLPARTPFDVAKVEWEKRRRRLGDRAVGRVGEDYTEQSIRITRALDLKGYYPHALDFGCGWGRFSNLLTHHCGHLWAVDIYEDWVERAARWAGVTGITLTSTEIPLEDDSMNLIVDIMTFQSIRSTQLRAEYAKELKRVLIPGGTVISLGKADDEWLRHTLPLAMGLDPDKTFTSSERIDEADEEYNLLVGIGGDE
jgi:ubiquinone/menaquinone biosynthesis C-methylase UbiE